MIIVVEEGIFFVFNVVLEISVIVGKVWRLRGEAGEKVESFLVGVMCASFWFLGKKVCFGS